MTSATQRDQQAVNQFVERFGGILADTGMARMPARILAALLTTDSGRLTAAEIADVLQISPAAVSGAVRYLTTVQVVSREREPGSRRDVYRMRDNVWYESTFRKDQMLGMIDEVLAEGVAALGADTEAGARLDETREFFRFMHSELGALLDRWRTHREKWLEERES
ncbi:MarR family transcriptional regulator [Lentzea sp. DG1S-22]|uniref:GbsR/MarR family transcriptional regulator n=1 Tax=unclassified Lentzea TaxID=2643253 RepID=UPI0027E0022B|nr:MULTISPECIES: MarR family transcriptional regulator [unclassified Lentzea]MCG8923633.1 MarR family transcriptional regulator [Lentzea sp. CC55]WVH83880.1 MarR family transcriptional regulator [Lentzea sp. DG1S-22]